MGKHIPKHYYVMRQYEEASGVVLEFLQFLRSEASSLPAGFPAELDEAIEVGSTTSHSPRTQTDKPCTKRGMCHPLPVQHSTQPAAGPPWVPKLMCGPGGRPATHDLGSQQ